VRDRAVAASALYGMATVTMSKKNSRRNQKSRKAQKAAVVPDAQTGEKKRQFKPKAGPNQIFRSELVGAQSGHAQRYKNVGASPMLLAYERGQLSGPTDFETKINSEDRKNAAEEFERLWFIIHRSGSDSTVQSTGGGNGLFWTESKQNASDKLAKIKLKMPPRDYVIVQRFCGEGETMAQALRGIVDVHPSSVTFRIREALDSLVAAVTGRLLISNSVAA
jgi:hypothetical protein